MRKKTDPEYTKVIKIKQCRSQSVLLDLDKAIWAPCLFKFFKVLPQFKGY